MLQESMQRSFGDVQNLANHCSVLGNLSLHSIALLLYQLGSLSPTTQSFLSPRTWQILSVDDIQLLIEVTYDLVRDWPIRFHEILHDDEVLVISNSIKCRHSPAIHRLRQFLFRNLPADLGFLLDGYRSYHRDISLDLITRRNTWATSDDVAKQRYLAAVNAARRIGIRTSTLHALADLSGVSTVQAGSGKRRYTLVSQHSLERIKEHLKDKVSLKAAAKLLGLSPGRVEQLVGIGVLHSHQTTSGLARTTFLSRAEISGLVAAIPPVSGVTPDTGSILPLSSISKHFLASRSEFGALIYALKTQAFLYVGHDPSKPGLAAFLLDKAEFLAWHRRQIHEPHMSVIEAAAHLRLHPEVCYHVVRHGLLATKDCSHGRRIYAVITSSALDRFTHTYITSVELRAVFRTPIGPTKRYLSSQGVAPVCAPTVDGCRTYIYRRSEVARVLPKPHHGIIPTRHE
ncbi:hypothetical protein [Paraburkholderia tropica]|uniref:hypothetical protein n=1 Tax=Paraburkholderia tropica TaxID=92647 RepID=UPI001FC88FAA|nr:hypothetical protein [Paraburkholderia tropica]